MDAKKRLKLRTPLWKLDQIAILPYDHAYSREGAALPSISEQEAQQAVHKQISGLISHAQGFVAEPFQQEVRGQRSPDVTRSGSSSGVTRERRPVGREHAGAWWWSTLISAFGSGDTLNPNLGPSARGVRLEDKDEDSHRDADNGDAKDGEREAAQDQQRAGIPALEATPPTPAAVQRGR